ncbi:MAG: hypothetical protein Q4B58_02585, partial [Bacteroidales bacterium]|nr:hypothetical protein [Bacteroidales bacterium]
MKKRYLLAAVGLLLMAAGTEVSAQSWLKSLGERAVDRAKTSVKNRVENKVDEKVDEQVDGLFNLGKKKDKSTSDNQVEEAESSAKIGIAWVCEECGKTGNTGKFCEDCGAKRPAGGTSADEAAPAAPAKKQISASYAKSDFVPGDEIFFDDDLTTEQMGEFPSKWDLLEGSAEVANFDGKPAIFLTEVSTNVEPLMDNQKSYLPEMFTLEFDFFAGDGSEIGTAALLRSYYEIRFYVGSDDIGTIEITPNEEEGQTGQIRCYIEKPSGDRITTNSDISNINVRSWNHLSLSFNKRALKVYINGTRVANLPNIKAPSRFSIARSHWEDHRGNYLTNIRLCKGAVPLYDRLSSTGKIITYAITFEHGKADLKPESMVEISRIAKLMQ